MTTTTLRSALHHQLILVQARSAARVGDLDQAARLLDEIDVVMASTVASLDLRARVAAQQGDLDTADDCWARVLLLNQDDQDARAGRDTIARIRVGRPARPLLSAGRAVVLSAALVAASVVGIAWIPFGHSGPAPTPVAAPPDATVAEIQRLERHIASLETQEKTAAARQAQQLDAIAAAFAMPGVRVERRTDDVRLVFTSGIFRSGTELAQGSRAVLADVGRRVARVQTSTTVVGHTVAIPGGRTRGGSTVAYARAQVAAQLLALSAELPLTAFTLATADQREGPFPDASRNRTVTLVLSSPCDAGRSGASADCRRWDR